MCEAALDCICFPSAASCWKSSFLHKPGSTSQESDEFNVTSERLFPILCRASGRVCPKASDPLAVSQVRTRDRTLCKHLLVILRQLGTQNNQEETCTSLSMGYM